MKLIAEAGTDVAMVVLFDPEALPDDFESRYCRDYVGLLEHLDSEGRIFLTATGADGSYLLHLYLEESTPDDLSLYCRDPIVFESFPVPSGSLWFCGAEYVFHRDDTQLRKYPHMGSRLEIPCGNYFVRIMRTEYPDEYIEDQVRAAMGAEAYQVYESFDNSIGCFIGMAFLSICIAAGLALSWFWFWAVLIAGIGLFLWIRILRMTRSATYQSLQQQSKSIQRNYPSMVAEFSLKSST